MSGSRNDLRKAKLRRERIRREKHAERTPPAPPPLPPQAGAFASERSLRDLHAMLEGHTFDNVEEINARVAELTNGGRLAELAASRKQDDPKRQAQQLAYDALETDDPVEALRLAYEAQKLDPDCVDAQRLMVSLLPIEEDNRLELMREVVASAEKNLGEAYFAENAGRFWGVTETRPYMRAKQHLAELLSHEGHSAEAMGVYERLLELNPTDNQGARVPLVGLYLAGRQTEAANGILERYPADEKYLASFAWARVLQRWLSGDMGLAQAALTHARNVNPHVEGYVSGRKALPDEPPSMFRPGDESEAQVCAAELSPAWLAHPGFRQWLQTQPAARRR